MKKRKPEKWQSWLKSEFTEILRFYLFLCLYSCPHFHHPRNFSHANQKVEEKRFTNQETHLGEGGQSCIINWLNKSFPFLYTILWKKNWEIENKTNQLNVKHSEKSILVF